MIVTYIFILIVAGFLFSSMKNSTPDYQSTVESDMNRIDSIINSANERIEAIKNGNY